MSDPNEKDEKPKTPEATLGSLAHEWRQFMHGLHEMLTQFRADIAAMKSTREKGVDITARVLAIIAIAVAAAAGLAVYFRPATITQEANPELHNHVDRPMSLNESAHEYVIQRTDAAEPGADQ